MLHVFLGEEDHCSCISQPFIFIDEAKQTIFRAPFLAPFSFHRGVIPERAALSPGWLLTSSAVPVQ